MKYLSFSFALAMFFVSIASAQESSVIKKPLITERFLTVPFQQVDDFKVLVKKYPFLAPSPMPDGSPYSIQDSDNEGAEFSDIELESKDRLLFYKLAGPEYCGSDGCSLDVYRERGNKYMLALSVTAHVERSLYFSRDGSSILLCNDKGQLAEWRFNEKTFDYQHIGIYVGSQPKVC